MPRLLRVTKLNQSIQLRCPDKTSRSFACEIFNLDEIIICQDPSDLFESAYCSTNFLGISHSKKDPRRGHGPWAVNSRWGIVHHLCGIGWLLLSRLRPCRSTIPTSRQLGASRSKHFHHFVEAAILVIEYEIKHIYNYFVFMGHTIFSSLIWDLELNVFELRSTWLARPGRLARGEVNAGSSPSGNCGA